MYRGTRQIAVWDWSTILSSVMLVSLFGRVKRSIVGCGRPQRRRSCYSAAAGFWGSAGFPVAAEGAGAPLSAGTAGVAGLAAGAGAGFGLGAAGGLTAG